MRHLVPSWSFIVESSRDDEIEEWFEDSGAYKPNFMSEDFYETVMSMKSKGWSESQMFVKGSPKKILNKEFFDLCISKHLEKHNVTKAIFSTVKPSMIDRCIRTDADYARVFDEWLSFLNDENLAKVFDTEDVCYGRSVKPVVEMWYSHDDGKSTYLEKICNNIITIGDGGEFSIDTSEEQGDITDILETYFIKNHKKEM